jgi:hypothetical protein
VDEIFNLACPASPVHYKKDPVQTTKTSVIGAINMLGLAKRLKIKVLQASTSEVYAGKDTGGITAEWAVFLYFLTCVFVLFAGGPAEVAKGLIDALSEVFPGLQGGLQGKEQSFEFGVRVMLGIGGIYVAVLWLGRLLGYIDKGDTFSDLMFSVLIALAPHWSARGFLRGQLEGGPKTEARIKYAARQHNIDDAVLQQARDKLKIKRYERVWALPK